jgi:hypothetical protein
VPAGLPRGSNGAARKAALAEQALRPAVAAATPAAALPVRRQGQGWNWSSGGDDDDDDDSSSYNGNGYNGNNNNNGDDDDDDDNSSMRWRTSVPSAASRTCFAVLTHAPLTQSGPSDAQPHLHQQAGLPNIDGRAADHLRRRGPPL